MPAKLYPHMLSIIIACHCTCSGAKLWAQNKTDVNAWMCVFVQVGASEKQRKHYRLPSYPGSLPDNLPPCQFVTLICHRSRGWNTSASHVGCWIEDTKVHSIVSRNAFLGKFSQFRVSSLSVSCSLAKSNTDYLWFPYDILELPSQLQSHLEELHFWRFEWLCTFRAKWLSACGSKQWSLHVCPLSPRPSNSIQVATPWIYWHDLTCSFEGTVWVTAPYCTISST